MGCAHTKVKKDLTEKPSLSINISNNARNGIYPPINVKDVKLVENKNLSLSPTSPVNEIDMQYNKKKSIPKTPAFKVKTSDTRKSSNASDRGSIDQKQSLSINTAVAMSNRKLVLQDLSYNIII